jgi:hypothetical protein
VSQFRAVAAGVVLYTAGHMAFKRLFEPAAIQENKPEAASPRPHRADGEKGARPSLNLPQQRWPRLSASRR